jgi:hypothetical protein
VGDISTNCSMKVCVGLEPTLCIFLSQLKFCTLSACSTGMNLITTSLIRFPLPSRNSYTPATARRPLPNTSFRIRFFAASSGWIPASITPARCTFSPLVMACSVHIGVMPALLGSSAGKVSSPGFVWYVGVPCCSTWCCCQCGRRPSRDQCWASPAR